MTPPRSVVRVDRAPNSPARIDWVIAKKESDAKQHR